MWKRSGLLVLLLLLVLGTNSVLAKGDNEIQDVARQLVSPDWEDVVPEWDEPLIAYSLHFIELSSYVGGFVEGTMDLSTSKEPQGGYTVVTDDAILSWVGEYPVTFQAELAGALERHTTGSDYEAWLITMRNKPVSVELAEARVGDGDDDGLDQELRITLTPRWCDELGEGILTDVSLDYLNPSGSMGKARLSTWIRSEMNPLAIVIQEVESKKQHSRRYFALFATATPMAPDRLPKSGPIVFIGKIGGLQGMFAETSPGKDEAMIRLSLGAGWLEEEISFNAGLEYEKEKYEAFAFARGFPAGMYYTVGLNLYLYEELGLAVLLSKDSRPDPVLRVGLSDKVRLSENVELEAVYLPFGYDWSKSHLASSPWLQFTARISHAEWGVWYRNIYDDGEMAHGVGITRQLTSDLDLEIYWNRDPAEGDYYGIGIVFRMRCLSR